LIGPSSRKLHFFLSRKFEDHARWSSLTVSATSERGEIATFLLAFYKHTFADVTKTQLEENSIVLQQMKLGLMTSEKEHKYTY